MGAAREWRKGPRTAVLTKLYPTRSHTGAAQGGMCAALANVEEDNWEWHTFDTVKGGDYLADQDAVEIMCKEAIDAVLDLEKMGMPFNRTPEGRIDQRRFGGHTRDHGKAPVRRACYAADRTGHMILQTLYQNCVKHDVQFFNEFYALDLALTETAAGPVATGVVAYELATGDIHVFHAKAIVLATGGSGRMYKTTSNAHTLTGITESARPYLGAAPATDRVRVSPTCHYVMGGIPTTVSGQVLRDNTTPLPGLYAAGECACVSVHGANRLGTNSLLDINVFGRRGGMAMAEHAEGAKQPAIPEKPEAETERMLRRLITGPNLEFAADIRSELQHHMFDLCGVVRTEEGLQTLHGRLQALRDRYHLVGMHDRGKRFNTELMEAVELGFLLDIAETVAAAALARDESRGGHYRDDHPLRDDDHWLRHSLAYRDGEGGLRLEYKDVKLGPYVPIERKYQGWPPGTTAG